MKLSTYKTNFFEGNLIIYLLLFFSPLINFVSNNLFFFEVQYFKFLNEADSEEYLRNYKLLKKSPQKPYSIKKFKAY